MRRFVVFCVFFLSSLVAVANELTCDDSWFTGEGTQYGGVAGSEGGNCGLPVDEGDIFHCALNHEQYDSSLACGACVRVLGPRGEITLKVVDRCPECKHGDIDLSTGAFELLAEMKDGRIPIKWQFVPCEIEDDIKVFYAPGSSQYYFKAQFRSHRYIIKKVEYLNSNGVFVPIRREMYNYFVCQGGIDEDKSKVGPYTFRITAANNDVLIAENVLYAEGGEVSLKSQFKKQSCPDCNGTIGGLAKIDNCGTCSGGDTGIEPNSTCNRDCIGYWKGEAYIDDCGKCVGGTTGGTPCAVESAIENNMSEKSFEYIVLNDLQGEELGVFYSFDEFRIYVERNKGRCFIARLVSENGIELFKFLEK